MDSNDFFSIFQYFQDKIDFIHQLIPLLKVNSVETSSENCKDDLEMVAKLSDLSAIVQEMEVMLNVADIELDYQKGHLVKKKEELIHKIDVVQSHCNHLSDFKCKFSSQKEAKSKLLQSKPIKKADVPKKNQNEKKSTVNETKQQPPKSKDIPMIVPISKNEFTEIPQYMRGRLTHELLNQGLASFVATLAAKYQLLTTHHSRYTEEQAKRVQMYKSQENSETVGHFFCTADDLKMYSTLKEVNSTRIVLTCLRHCKRIKEIRGPGKIIRYAIEK